MLNTITSSTRLIISIFGWICLLFTVILSSPVQLTSTDQIIQIGDREPYKGKLTSLSFYKPLCIIALNLHTLQPLTGAEDIEITYNLCESKKLNSTWTLTHYTNNKNIFILRHPILAKRIAIIAGYGRNNPQNNLNILNIEIEQCDKKQIFGIDDDIDEDHELYRHCNHQKSKNLIHKHRHKHHESSVMKIDDLKLDQLLPYKATFKNTNDDAIFIRHKRQISKVK